MIIITHRIPRRNKATKPALMACWIISLEQGGHHA